MRKILIAALGVFGSSLGASLQVHLTLLLLMLVIMATSFWKPYRGASWGPTLQRMEMGTLFATWVTVWAGSIFGTYPRCENPDYRHGSLTNSDVTLGWCTALSVAIGVGDIAAFFFVFACYFYQTRQALIRAAEGCRQKCGCCGHASDPHEKPAIMLSEVEMGSVKENDHDSSEVHTRSMASMFSMFSLDPASELVRL